MLISLWLQVPGATTLLFTLVEIFLNTLYHWAHKNFTEFKSPWILFEFISYSFVWSASEIYCVFHQGVKRDKGSSIFEEICKDTIWKKNPSNCQHFSKIKVCALGLFLVSKYALCLSVELFWIIQQHKNVKSNSDHSEWGTGPLCVRSTSSEKLLMSILECLIWHDYVLLCKRKTFCLAWIHWVVQSFSWDPVPFFLTHPDAEIAQSGCYPFVSGSS